MGFILKENDIYIHTKLTDVGRKKIAEGKFIPTKFRIGDSEIDYKYYNDNTYQLGDMIVQKPLDKNPNLITVIPNVSGDNEYNYFINNIISNENIITKEISTLGFFDGNIYENSLKINDKFLKQPHLEYNLEQLDINNNKNLFIEKTNEYGTIINTIESGDYLLMSFNNNDFKDGIIDPDYPTPYLWYKILNVSGDINISGYVLNLDKDLPNFNGESGTGYCYVFPKSDSMQYFYNTTDLTKYWQEGFFNFTDTCNTSPTRPTVWNMNILYTDRIIGVKTNDIANNKYNSSQYNGFLNYIRNENYSYKNIGIIHFTNLFPENIMGDELLGETIELLLPTIIWNQNTDNKIGIKLVAGIDELNLGDITTTYYDLIDNNNNSVGKIFTKLKLIIIEDQELLFAMSYKSNRNWTLPKQLNNFNISFC